ncbi:hypothetical protein FA95DRAFT_1487771 [Auriscalpium vulgare]|uniref:Uncharacterized protein n=1 Tax=Auriscalpium vulgare TaxID=40419 RepID=A0ACB8S277_9AGAM|nr:hypothetical protein FA95DRAFT_1487771 [Auriscalpium vulgare]
MHLDHLLARQDNCISCPASPPPCNCQANEHCVQLARSCTACSTFQCLANTSAKSGKGGVSAGAVAGAVVGALILLGLGVAAYWWWRRRALKSIPEPEPEVKDVPAPADTVLSRPNPNEKPPSVIVPPQESSVRVYGNGNSVIDLDPSSHGSTTPSRRYSIASNPFADAQSIQTTSTGSQSTNVIPIALVPPGTVSPVSPRSPVSHDVPLPPARPARGPDDHLNMEHVNFSSDSAFGQGSSIISDMSGASNRHSYLTEASFASDVLTEAPTIVTQSQRQVLGVVKAEVVLTPSTPPASATSSRMPVRSPLAASSFGPQDVLVEADESQTLQIHNDPFSDDRSHATSPGVRSSMATMGTGISDASSSMWATQEHPWNNATNTNERPMSTYTQAASVIGADIMDATRVHLGFAQPTSASIVPATPLSSSVGSTANRGFYRMTNGRLVSPPSTSSVRANVLEKQQERAMAEVQAAKSPDADASHRMSMSTMASGMSTRADSILESFTFVPPSPISNRPIRTPPRSPLMQETHNNPYTVNQTADTLPRQDHRTLRMSSGSQLSSMTTGLGSFPFQIDHGAQQEPQLPSPPTTGGRQRASLDTLALTSDLSSYPLGFDRPSQESFAAFQKAAKKL